MKLIDRCDQDLSAEQRSQRVDRALKMVHLEHARKTLVGSHLLKGISGGERKRLSVALELLTEPKLLFLDEPTSGLDSVTALNLCTTLKDLSARVTIVTTIHQPQAKIFAMFQCLILMDAGNIVFQGPIDEALAMFEEKGYPCPGELIFTVQ